MAMKQIVCGTTTSTMSICKATFDNEAKQVLRRRETYYNILIVGVQALVHAIICIGCFAFWASKSSTLVAGMSDDSTRVQLLWTMLRFSPIEERILVLVVWWLFAIVLARACEDGLIPTVFAMLR